MMSIISKLLGSSESKSVSTNTKEPRLFIDFVDGEVSLVPNLEGVKWVESVYVLFRGPQGLGSFMVATPRSCVGAIAWARSYLPDDCEVVCAHSVPEYDWHQVGSLSQVEFAIQRAR